MAQADVNTATEPRELSQAELREVLDERTRRRFGLSLDEFIKRLDAGDLPDTAAVNDIAVLIAPGTSVARPGKES